MYGYGLGTMQQVMTDLQQSKLENIRNGARLQGAVGKGDFLGGIATFVRQLFTPLTLARSKSQAYQSARFYELDCQRSATPCA